MLRNTVVLGRNMMRAAWMFGLAGALGLPAAGADWLPLSCAAEQTVGMHDNPGAPEHFDAAMFVASEFALRENALFMEHLLGVEEAAPALYITMTAAGGETEFECRKVRGAGDATGYSCVNNPPAEILLLNPRRGRFTRSAVGGWTFPATQEGGASLFIEYGACRPAPPIAAGDAG